MCPLPVTWIWWDCVWESCEGTPRRVFVCITEGNGWYKTDSAAWGEWWSVEAWRRRGSGVIGGARHYGNNQRRREGELSLRLSRQKPRCVVNLQQSGRRQSSEPSSIQMKFKLISCFWAFVELLLDNKWAQHVLFFKDLCQPFATWTEFQMIKLKGSAALKITWRPLHFWILLYFMWNFEIVSKDLTSQREKKKLEYMNLFQQND